MTTRVTVSDPWGPPVNLGATVNSASNEECPFISFDGLSLYFSSFRLPCLGGQYGGDLWVTTRATPSDPWGPPVHLDRPVNSKNDEYCPYVSPDGLLLLFSGNPPPIRPVGYIPMHQTVATEHLELARESWRTYQHYDF